MRIGLAVGATAIATVGLAGCAGVPVALSAASLYVDTVLYLRTEKSATDHILSAAADRDCGLMNLFREGRICTDEPAPALVAEIMREVEMVPPGTAVGPRVRVPVEIKPAAVAQTAVPAVIEVAAKPAVIEVAAAPPTMLADASPAAGPAPLPARTAAPDRKPPTVARVAYTAPKPAIEPAVQRGEARFLVVVGSFAKRDQAERHRERLDRPGAEIVAATVRGRTYHRVVLPPAGRGEALREVALVRTAGIPDAWMLPWSGHVDVDTAVAALPLVGFLYRM